MPHNIAALFMRLVGSMQEQLGRGSCYREKKQEGHAVRPRLSGKWWPQKKHDQLAGLEELNAVHVFASDLVLIVGSRRMHPITRERAARSSFTCNILVATCIPAGCSSSSAAMQALIQIPAARDCRYQQEYCVCTYLQLSIKSILDLHFHPI